MGHLKYCIEGLGHLTTSLVAQTETGLHMDQSPEGRGLQLERCFYLYISIQDRQLGWTVDETTTEVTSTYR